MLDLIGSSLTVFVFLALLVIFVLFKTALVVPNQQAVVVERLGKFHAVLFAASISSSPSLTPWPTAAP